MSAEDAPTISDSQFEVSLGSVGPGSLVFGRYRLEKELGRGGMGVVWLAHDEKVDMQVALKFLPDVVARDSESVDELKRELRRGLTLTHPGIVRVYSFEQDQSGAAIAMEYVDGPTLSSLKLKQPCHCFEVDEILPLLEQLCATLDYAHFEAKIVHRDLKPRNLMLTSKGRLKIADFGVATTISDTISRATNRRDGSGTPPYMSPQQAFGENPSPSDDIYSLGATLYELLTGRAPFYQGNILAQVQQRVPPSLAERREVLKVSGRQPIPPTWEATIAATLAKLPEDRPERASDVLLMVKGEMTPPKGGHTASKPMNPALRADSIAPPLPSRKTEAFVESGIENDETVSMEESTARGSGVRPPPVPVRPKKKSSMGGIFVLGLLIAAGVGIVWKQREEATKTQAELAAIRAAMPGSGEMPVATPLPLNAAPAGVSAEERMKSEAAAREAANREARAADEAAAAAGKIPRADAPWENGMQMKFVPVPGMTALVSVFETRLDHYREFAATTKRPLTPTEFEQGDSHPVVNVSWIDAVSFCEWLTKKERAEGVLGKTQRYRLLTDAEWSRAVGLPPEEGRTPQENSLKNKTIFPWGTESVPPNGTENLAGDGETTLKETELTGYKDDFSHTAPVGTFKVNRYGLYDLGGNVSEWVEDWYDESKSERTTRGAAFVYIAPFDRCSSFRWHLPPHEFADYVGFRVALDPGTK